MVATPTQLYVAGFVARCHVGQPPGRLLTDQPGVHGLLPTSTQPQVRLVVDDDRGFDVLTEALQHAGSGTVAVFDTAPRCHALLTGRSGWAGNAMTAMARGDLTGIADHPLPPDLQLRPVRRLPDDDPAAVVLEHATALVEPDHDTDGPDALADHLRSLPRATRLFAATDAHGNVRATSGFGGFDGWAHVLFVNTAPELRGRGIGTAMTAAALRAARIDGAHRAYLDASSAGHGVYARLGFRTAAHATRFTRRP